MTHPIIGLTINRLSLTNPLNPYQGLSETYIRAVSNAGGIPLLIPLGLSQEHFQALYAHVDGLLLTGGSDIDPARFKGRSHIRVTDIDTDRDALEIALVQRAIESGKPLLGICRGIQAINVALGGTLYTDLADQYPNALRHDWYPDVPRDYPAHEVAIEPSSRLAGILGVTRPQVNSLHHQGLERVADGLTVVGKAPDGLVEAVELPAHPFFIGVQWHPEWLQEVQAMRDLFSAFIRAAGKGK